MRPTLRFAATAATSIALTFALAVPALGAGDNGEGLAGETDDKIVTFASLGVVVFFALVALIGTAIQSRLEHRKDERKAVAMRQRSGW